MSGQDLSVPDLVDVEVVSVLRRRWLAKTLTARRSPLRSMTSQRFQLTVACHDRDPARPRAGVVVGPSGSGGGQVSARAEVGAGDDGHYFVVRGRRWRASDPNIPDALRAELVAELMSARREVRNDPGTARPRVHDAKVALGERGEPWWEPTDAGQRERLRAAIRTLLRHRSPEASICPSDVARVVGGTRWRGLMSTAREVVSELADHEVVRVQQRGQPVDPRTATGPLRVARGPQW